MREADGIQAHAQGAEQYDEQARQFESYGHDVLFGMSYEYVRAGERLLDLGIGTGLSSAPFARAGLEVYGLDGSPEMLRVCESKGFARELRLFDLRKAPLPYPDGFFSHVICCGVFHFLEDLAPIMAEVSRVMGKHGIFGFTVAVPPERSAPPGAGGSEGRLRMDTPWGVAIWAHGAGYLEGLLRVQDFAVHKRQRLLVLGGPEGGGDLVFAACVAGGRGA
jgi:SAM-dependent methyltransferase